MPPGLLPPRPGYQDPGSSGSGGGGPFCLRGYQVSREYMDVLSVHFRPLDRVAVLVQSDMPSVMRLQLNTGMDSGGSLAVSLWANQVPSSGAPRGLGDLGAGAAMLRPSCTDCVPDTGSGALQAAG